MKEAYIYKHNPIVKRIFLSMLAPTILMNLTTAIGSVADTIIIGQYLDELSLSVVTFATPIFMIINTFAALFAVGGCISMSIDSGKGNKKSANQAFSASIELLCFVGILLYICGTFFSNTITGWLGATGEVFGLVEQYSRIILIGGPVFVLNIGLAFFVRNDGQPTLSMVGMFSSIVVDVILNFVFVGHLGWGVAGAAYSTVFGQIVSILIICTHFLSSKNTLKFKFTFNKTILRIIKNGVSSALNFIYQFLVILIMNHILVKIAPASGVIIYTVVFNLSTVSLSVFEGISQTIQPMISNYFGEKSFKNIKATLRLALIAIFAICGSVTLILEIVPNIVPVVFGIEDVLLIEKASVAVRIFATSMIIMTINVVISYYLQSTEQTTIATIFVSLRSFILLLISTIILGLSFGMNGIWASYTTAEVLSLIFIICLLRKKKNNKADNKKTYCFTYSSLSGDLDDFVNYVSTHIKDSCVFSQEIYDNTSLYLNLLKKAFIAKKNRYIEIEINTSDRIIIIRDNIKNTDISDSTQKSFANNSDLEYGPVLGWNRMYIKQGE